MKSDASSGRAAPGNKRYSYLMSQIPDLRRRTKAALSIARQAVLHDARETVETHGVQAIIVTRLAKRHDVAPLTVRRWLGQAGFALDHLTRGRPSFAKVAGLETPSTTDDWSLSIDTTKEGASK